MRTVDRYVRVVSGKRPQAIALGLTPPLGTNLYPRLPSKSNGQLWSRSARELIVVAHSRLWPKPAVLAALQTLWRV